MLRLSESAREELNAYFEGKEKSDIRVFLASGGCCGVRLSMAIDEPLDSDQVFETGGFSFIVSKELLEVTGAIDIDMGPMGFSITSENPIGSSEGSGCGGCPAAGSCGT